MKNSLQIVFFGTPEFAVESLKVLLENQIKVVAVVTATDKPKGRSKKPVFSSVKEYALTQNLPILQPANLKDPEFLDKLKSYNADLQIVVAFRMLPVVVWDMPKFGTFNLHASLLPQYRGAAPINWAIINGEKETGVTTFLLKHEIDTGKIIFQETEEIKENDTVGELHERLKHKGAKIVLKTVYAIEADNYPQIDQNESIKLKYAPKIFRKDCEIDWNKSGYEIQNFIRGLSPYPGAWTEFRGSVIKVFEVKKSDVSLTQGEFDSDGENFLRIGCSDGSIEILDLQLSGKKRMRIKDFMRGYTH